MSDYNFDVDVLRGKMADELANNTEQFVFVISNALAGVDLKAAIDEGRIGDEADASATVVLLRDLANAIEEGDVT